MKASLTPLLFILLLLTFSCSKDENCDNPVDCLPPLTQTGANTAGCLVNGRVLLPSGRSLGSGSVLHSQYLFHQEAYIFSIGINDRKNNQLVFIRNNAKLEEGGFYPIELKSDTTGSGAYIIGGAGSGIGYITTNEEIGQLHITKLDEAKKIISGTFWFDAINNEDDIVQVREGRFDVHYQ